MKKLLFWAVLLMTGFAFHSCDERFDNPATETPDPSDPASTWTYQVKISFADFNPDDIRYWDAEAEEFKYYENPTTVFVYNQKGEKLGALSVTEEYGDTFAGTLNGAIGDTLIISSLEDFDYYSKQDGSIESIVKYGILQVAKVPIIIANSTTGKIGTQAVKMETATQVFGIYFGDWCFFDSFKIISDNIRAKSNSIAIKFDEEASKNSTKYISLAFVEKEKADYTFEIAEKEEAGFTFAKVIFEDAVWAETDSETKKYIYWDEAICNLKSVDLTKYYNYRKSLNEDAGDDWKLYLNLQQTKDIETLVYQSGEEALPVSMNLNEIDKITLKSINIKGNMQVNKYYVYNGKGTDITIEGNNVIEGVDSYWGGILPWGALVTLKGNGSITVNGVNYGADIYSRYRLYDEEGNYVQKPSELIIDDNVKFTAKNTVYLEGSGILTVKGGTFEALGKEGQVAIVMDSSSKLNIGTGITSFKATAGEGTSICILDNATGSEAVIDKLVADKTKFDYKKEEGVVTITPKQVQ